MTATFGEDRPSGGLLLPTLLAAAVLVVLLLLGTWQWQRMIWKDGLIRQIAERATAAPIPLAAALQRTRAGEDLEYTPVRATGRWLHDRERRLWSPSPAGPGWDIFTPLVTASGEIVIVNRGFVADADRDRARRPEPEAPAAVTGLLRRPEIRNTFTPDNDVAANVWYWRDLEGMTRSMVPERTGAVAPFFLDAVRRPPGEAAAARVPRGGATRLELPNNHLQYAMTWYGLALTLIGVYVAFVLPRLRSRPGSAGPGRRDAA